MATQWQTFNVEFKGGLISNMSLLQQGTNAIGSAFQLSNFEVNKEGGYSKILGYTKFSDVAVPGEGDMLGLKVISSTRMIAARKINSAAATNTLLDNSHSGVATGITSNLNATFDSSAGTLTNAGTIAGRGGNGGRGAYTYQQNKSQATRGAEAGGNGGNGLVIEGVPVTLINNNIIQAGGGGGGGGGLQRSSNKNGASYTNGGQGGGGAAYGTGANPGTLSAGGAGQTVSGAGDGGAGGAPGSAGSAGTSSSSAGGAGGKPGWAILGADQVTFTTVGTITGSSGVVRSGTIDVYRVV